jgi:hypothetical protein
MSEEKRSLVRKLSEVMGAVKRIPKNGTNKFHNYKYAMESDVLDVVRDELSKRNVMMMPRVLSEKVAPHQTKSGSTEYIGTVTVCFDFHDGDSGETLPVITVGQGQDAGDKSFYKALTGATKYALLKTFLIPSGDDPEADDAVDRSNAPSQLGTAAAVAAVRQQEPAQPYQPGLPATHDRNLSFKFGNMKGIPISQLSDKDIGWYRQALVKDMANPEKAKWARQNALDVACIDAELRHRAP